MRADPRNGEPSGGGEKKLLFRFRFFFHVPLSLSAFSRRRGEGSVPCRSGVCFWD